MNLGKLTKFNKISNTEYEFVSGYAKVKLMFYRDDIFRIWLAPDGEYTNPAAKLDRCRLWGKEPESLHGRQRQLL